MWSARGFGPVGANVVRLGGEGEYGGFQAVEPPGLGQPGGYEAVVGDYEKERTSVQVSGRRTGEASQDTSLGCDGRTGESVDKPLPSTGQRRVA